MSRLLTDSWEQEQHFSLKRWERGAQRAAWARRSLENAALPLPCPWRLDARAPLVHHAAHVLALFAGDLAVVRFVRAPGGASGADAEPVSEQASEKTSDHAQAREQGGEAAGIRVIRGGLPWERWSAAILSAWKNAAPVPEPFRLRHRLPPQWLDQALAASPSDQVAFLAKLREGGILPPLQPVTPEAVAPWLRWDEMRARLIDARPEA